ncbi:MAG: serine/threonine protein kinase [Rhodocyclaceae bacterium]|nr:serine/threonine protein kinase [Rhodocyclaceae bacterium]
MDTQQPDFDAAGEAPYAGLTPDVVLEALDAVGLFSDGRMLALNSFENRVYQVCMDEGAPVVVKFYRPGRWSDAQILEEHAFLHELAEHEVPVVAPRVLGGAGTLASHAGFRFAVFPRQGGRVPDLEHCDTLERLGCYIGRIHAVGCVRPFKARPQLGLASHGREPRDWLAASGFVPDELRASWLAAVDQALEGVARCFARAGDVRTLRLHGDCHAGNVLWTGGPHFVDFDDARSGPAVQDLWMLADGLGDAARAFGCLLRGYRLFMDFDRRELLLVEALRTLRLIHYSYWIARRWTDPAFPAAFPWFGTARYWQDRILELKEQIALLDEPALAVE